MNVCECVGKIESFNSMSSKVETVSEHDAICHAQLLAWQKVLT